MAYTNFQLKIYPQQCRRSSFIRQSIYGCVTHSCYINNIETLEIRDKSTYLLLITLTTGLYTMYGVTYLMHHNSQSTTTFSTSTLRLVSFYKPNMSSSYLAVLFVNSNSKQIQTKCFLCNRSIKTQLALEPSYILDLSKYKVHILFVQGLLAALVLLSLLLLLFQSTVQVSFFPIGQGRRPNYVSGGVGVGCAR